MNHLHRAGRFSVEVTRAEAEDFDAVVLAGGVANPDQLPAVEFIQEMFSAGRPTALDTNRISCILN